MQKYIYTIATVIALLSAPAIAGSDHDHQAPLDGAENAVPSHGHGSPHDDHSKIMAMDVTPELAVSILETGLADLMVKAEDGAVQDVTAGAFSLMSAVKTLKDEKPNERQAAALKQLDQQLDGAKHAAEDSQLEKAKLSITKAQSALKLYKAVK